MVGERIFRTGQQKDPREATSSSNALGSPTLYGDDITENASKTFTNSSQGVKVEVSGVGDYAVARAIPVEVRRVNCGAGSEEDKGRRRHDLFMVSGTRRPAHPISLFRRYFSAP